MKILITGASSYVGARLYLDMVGAYGVQNVVGTYFSNNICSEFRQLDVRDADAFLAIAREVSPDIVVHAVANPSAKWCEANPKAARDIHEGGAKNAVDAANAIGAKMMLISSTAASRPINVYNSTKLGQERLAKGCTAGYLILRPALVLGYSPNTRNDRSFNRILRNLRDGAPAVYDTSWRFEPTWIGHISEVIAEAARRGIWNDTIPVVVPTLKSRYDIARDILGRFGIEVNAKDEHDSTPTITEGDARLRELGLPTHSYGQVIDTIVSEINGASRFSLPS